MILALSVPLVRGDRLGHHLTHRVGLGHVGVDAGGGPPYLATYSFTIFWLAGLAYPGYQPFGTIIPSRCRFRPRR